MRAGFTDVADYLFKKSKDKELIGSTTDNSERIDQFWVSQAVVPALKSYKTTDKNPEATDHYGIVIEIDTEQVDTQHMWEPEKL